ncbi:MAG: TonB-dependent receptor, partial [Pseudomonadota bacterium]
AKTPLGLDIDLLETPAAVSVISQDLLQDLQVNNVDDALRNVAGVTKFKTGNGGEEKFTIRGFDVSQSIFKDGARINNGLNASNIPSTETANIEQIEVLKGPSALLYGEGGPGGVINYITKRPQKGHYTSIELLAGSNDFYKVELDTTGGFTDDSPFAYRLVLSLEDSNSFRAEHFRERVLFNPTVSYTPSDRSTFVLGVEYIDDEYTQDRGQVLDGDLFTGYFYPDILNEDVFIGIPGFNDRTNAESTRVYLTAEHQFNDSWRVEATYAETENNKALFDTNPDIITPTIGFIGDAGTPFENVVAITANVSDSVGNTDQITLKNFFDFETGGVSHQILASLTRETFDTVATGFGSTDTVFYNLGTRAYGFNDPFTPVDIRAQDISLFPTGEGTRQDFEERGFNILDYMTLNDKWSVLIGARWSNYEDNLSDFDDDDVSIRAGVVYSLNPAASVYLSYAEGYSSSRGLTDLNDNVIDPEISTSWELGAKWRLSDERLLVTATLFAVELDGVAFLINPFAPAADQRFGNIGVYETNGLEVEFVGKITDRWRIQAGYTYMDNEITEGGSTGSFGPITFSFEPGNRLGGVPEHSLNLTSFYEFPIGPGQLGVGGSVFYQDDTFASAENAYVYDGWTEVGLAAYYKWDQWKVQLNVRNLLDEDYRLTQIGVTPDIFAAIRVGTSQPRTLIASVAYEF